MKTAKTFKYENRLAGALVSKGGLSVGEAMRAAETQVEVMREPTIADIDARLAEIDSLSERVRAEADQAALDAIYAASNRIVALGGVFGLGELGKAAYSLCELVSRMERPGPESWPLIAVHLNGLRLLRNPDAHSQAQRADVLKGLAQVASSIPPPAQAKSADAAS
ncbi:MAG: hypothetical protein ACREEW_15075 [Caulobacteraceae bacterium]